MTKDEELLLFFYFLGIRRIRLTVSEHRKQLPLPISHSSCIGISYNIIHSLYTLAQIPHTVKEEMAILKFLSFLYLFWAFNSTWAADEGVFTSSKLKMFVDELPDMPRVRGFSLRKGVPVSKSLKIGMYEKTWVST